MRPPTLKEIERQERLRDQLIAFQTGTIVIDPPIGPYASPDEMRAWLGRLQVLRGEVDPSVRPQINKEIKRTRAMLARRMKRDSDPVSITCLTIL